MKLLASIVVFGAAAFSSAAVFNFETLATGNIGAFSLTDSGVTANFGGVAHRVDDMGSSAPVGWLSRSLLPNLFLSNHMTVDFSSGQSSVGFQFADFGSDDDLMHLVCYDGAGLTGNIVGSAAVFYGANLSAPNDVGTIFVSTSGGPILSVDIWEDGATGQNDIYIDNLTVAPVPEPATVSVLVLGLAALLRRKKQ